uniref:Uncharacterized protein n=1 Tax=Ciona savignyi TaxID=51511 RepID=H2Z5G2_CIOSA
MVSYHKHVHAVHGDLSLNGRAFHRWKIGLDPHRRPQGVLSDCRLYQSNIRQYDVHGQLLRPSKNLLKSLAVN